MNETNNDVSKSVILRALIGLSDKLDVFENNISALLEEKVPEIENAVHEQVKESVVVLNDGPSNVNIDLLGKQDLRIETTITRFPLLCIEELNNKSTTHRFPLLCIKVRYERVNVKAKSCRMLPIAARFWFKEDRSEFFKPFKELTLDNDLIIHYPAN